MIIVTRSKGPAGSGSSVYTSSEKLNMELEMSFKAAKIDNYTEYGYTDGTLTSIDIWETAAKLVKLFGKAFTYNSGDLTKIVLTRVSDGATLTKDFTYSDGALSTMTQTKG